MWQDRLDTMSVEYLRIWLALLTLDLVWRLAGNPPRGKGLIIDPE
jgi:hypothetical protein